MAGYFCMFLQAYRFWQFLSSFTDSFQVAAAAMHAQRSVKDESFPSIAYSHLGIVQLQVGDGVHQLQVAKGVQPKLGIFCCALAWWQNVLDGQGCIWCSRIVCSPEHCSCQIQLVGCAVELAPAQ